MSDVEEHRRIVSGCAFHMKPTQTDDGYLHYRCRRVWNNVLVLFELSLLLLFGKLQRQHTGNAAQLLALMYGISIQSRHYNFRSC